MDNNRCLTCCIITHEIADMFSAGGDRMREAGVAVIGGGAAGLFAGCFLKMNGADLVILERNTECGLKLLITGHGRCNITNLKEPRELKRGYHEASNFVYPAINSFPPSACVRFIEDEVGIRLKTEENDRVFPVSDKASDIRDGLVRYIGKDRIITGFKCVSIRKDDALFEIVSEDDSMVKAKYVILACGGMSYPHTGSDGSGFKLASALGHSIAKPAAALATVNTSAEFCGPLAGVTVPGVVLTLYDRGAKRAVSRGDLLFTHKGISGPSVMELSREIPARPDNTYILADLAPGITDRSLTELIDSKPRALFATVLASLVPRRLAESLLDDTQIKCSGVTSAERKKILGRLKRFRFDINEAPDINSAYCTRGGVELSELDRKSFGSGIIPGLFIIGENTDVDGISGGYNLAFAAASAHLAVKSIVG